MFKIISIMFVGLGTGYLLRDLKLMRKTEKTIPLTVFAMLFILGMSVGSNSLIVSNLGRFSGQAALHQGSLERSLPQRDRPCGPQVYRGVPPR